MYSNKEIQMIKRFHRKKVNMKEFNKMRADIQHIDEVLCNIDNKIEYFVHLISLEVKNDENKE